MFWYKKDENYDVDSFRIGVCLDGRETADDIISANFFLPGLDYTELLIFVITVIIWKN